MSSESKIEPISVTIPSKAVGSLFVEMVTQSATKGPSAKNLAILYEQAEAVAAYYGIKLPPPPE